MNNRSIGWIIAIGIGVLLSLFVIGLYFYTFYGVLSDNQSDWAAFGSYIGGIAAIVNVGVFVWLTLAIKSAGDEERVKERKHQRDLILSQMRQEELRNFANILNDATVIEIDKLQGFKFLNASGYILAFMQCFKNLFPILKDGDFIQELTDICKILTAMRKISMECAGFDENGIMVPEPKPLPSSFIDHNRKYQELKIKVISRLEEYIIDNINEEKWG